MNYVVIVYAITFIVLVSWWFIRANKDYQPLSNML